MIKRLLSFTVVLFACARTLSVAENAPSPQACGVLAPFQKTDRVLILAPHPDDETIGCAGVIQQALAAGAQVRVAYLSNGDHNQVAFVVYEKRFTIRQGEFIHMGEVRRKEAINAMKVLGLPEQNLIFFGYPDFGTLAIFSQFWKTDKPFKSFLTRISSVPYRENFSFGKPYVGESVLADFEKALTDFKPTKIFVTHPADVNRDHKALYLFLQVALANLSKELPAPKIYLYLIHRVAWPLPRHYHPELSLEPPSEFLDGEQRWVRSDLTDAQLNKKYQAVLAYRSQTRVSAFYLLAFARKNELFAETNDLILKPQVSPKEQAVQFFGFSDMYPEMSEWGVVNNFESSEDREKVSYAVVDDALLIHVEKNKELNRTLSMELYLFGYSEKIPFAHMPKIRILTKYNKMKIFDNGRLIKSQGVSLVLHANDLIMRVPLAVLGNPDFILSSIKVYRQAMPADATGFRKIVIRQGGSDA